MRGHYCAVPTYKLILEFHFYPTFRSIEKKLVDPYRNDPELRAEFLREVMEREATRSTPKKEVRKTIKVVVSCGL